MWYLGFSWQWEFVFWTFLGFLCHTEQKGLVDHFFFFFFFNYLFWGFLKIWGWASQLDLPSSHDVLVQPQSAVQNMTPGALK